jgi:hypothetical protein
MRRADAWPESIERRRLLQCAELVVLDKEGRPDFEALRAHARKLSVREPGDLRATRREYMAGRDVLAPSGARIPTRGAGRRRVSSRGQGRPPLTAGFYTLAARTPSRAPDDARRRDNRAAVPFRWTRAKTGRSCSGPFRRCADAATSVPSRCSCGLTDLPLQQDVISARTAATRLKLLAIDHLPEYPACGPWAATEQHCGLSRRNSAPSRHESANLGERSVVRTAIICLGSFPLGPSRRIPPFWLTEEQIETSGRMRAGD